VIAFSRRVMWSICNM